MANKPFISVYIYTLNRYYTTTRNWIDPSQAMLNNSIGLKIQPIYLHRRRPIGENS